MTSKWGKLRSHIDRLVAVRLLMPVNALLRRLGNHLRERKR